MKLQRLAKFIITGLIPLMVAGLAHAGNADISSNEYKTADTDARPNEEITITGTVKYMKIDGGFWGFVGDDEQNYEPNIPEKYRKDGLRIILRGKFRKDVGSFTMTGPVIEVYSIKEIRQRGKYHLLDWTN